MTTAPLSFAQAGQRSLIVNGRVLHANGELLHTSLLIENGVIAAICDDAPQVDQILDAHGALVLPGIVDLHGDAFERQLLPRPGVHFPPELALLETDRQMLSNGITTAFHGITYSWEPGLRGHNNAFALIEQIEQLRPRLRCDTRIHLRWETFNLAGEQHVAQLLREQRIDLLAFNDHINDIREDLQTGKRHKLGAYTHRTGLDTEAFTALFEQVTSHADQVPDAIARLATLATQLHTPCASHDDDSRITRQRFNDLGVQLSEFPVNEEVAELSRHLGNPVILGGPNVVRGSSHCGRLDATQAAAQGLCDVLTSDYYYPSLLRAVFLLMQRNNISLGETWPLVAANPAQAAGLHDRGVIETGRRADLLLVDDSGPIAEVAMTLTNGEIAYASRSCLAA